jgi:hypothetical protein
MEVPIHKVPFQLSITREAADTKVRKVSGELGLERNKRDIGLPEGRHQIDQVSICRQSEATVKETRRTPPSHAERGLAHSLS